MLDLLTAPLSDSPGDAQDVRIRRDELGGAEREAVAALDVESRPLDHWRGVTAEVTAASDPRPERCVRQALHPSLERALRNHVLVEAKLPARSDDAGQLGECALLVRDRAEDEAGDAGVTRGVLEWQGT